MNKLQCKKSLTNSTFECVFFHHALKIRVFLVLVCMSVLFSILVINIAGHVLPVPSVPLPLTGSTGPDQMFAWGFKEKGYYVIKKAIGPDFWFLFCCRSHVGQAFFHDQTCKIILFLELEQHINSISIATATFHQ